MDDDDSYIENLTDEEKLDLAKRHLSIVYPSEGMEPNWWIGMRLLEKIRHVTAAHDIFTFNYYLIRYLLAKQLTGTEFTFIEQVRRNEEEKNLKEFEEARMRVENIMESRHKEREDDFIREFNSLDEMVGHKEENNG